VYHTIYDFAVQQQQQRQQGQQQHVASTDDTHPDINVTLKSNGIKVKFMVANHQ
jgi:hypothetical protein